MGVKRGGVLFVQADDRVLAAVRLEQLVDALLEAVGPEGAVVMSAATPENSPHSAYTRAALAGLTNSAQEVCRSCMPPFDRATTPVSASAGALAEVLRRHPAGLRSAHPQHSFVAVGRWADYLMAGHRLDSPHGEHSPLLRLYQSHAQALLLGVPLSRCLAWNLAAERLPPPLTRGDSCVVRADGGSREWVAATSVAVPDPGVPELVEQMETHLPLQRGTVADGTALVVPVEVGVDLVTSWLTDITG
ncbi:AAC(3) family N-acetyltransferase [Kitasatospora griseola]|uniref:AAC(3) family N-acetyltransferase n=1 Tax=Kitasatospora griseola TaxID=2064 RepID=UPI003827C235